MANLRKKKEKTRITIARKGLTGRATEKRPGLMIPAENPVECTTCNDAGFVTGVVTGVVPCPRCNPDGMEIEGEAS